MKAKRLEELLNEQELFDGEFTQKDKELYQLLFTELSDEVDVKIPMNFADKVANKVMAKATLWSDVKLYAFYSGFFLILTTLCFTFFGFDTTASGKQTQNFLSGNLPLIFIGTLVYFVIQTLDRVFVKGRIS
jgi:hypothetical protein